jgi:putative sigma-54 modulation protein
MTIEIETPHKKITEKLIRFITTEIIKLSHSITNISRAEILLREDETKPGENKICDIKLSILGDNLSAHTRTEKFERSVKEAISELEIIGKHRLKKTKLLENYRKIPFDK